MTSTETKTNCINKRCDKEPVKLYSFSQKVYGVYRQMISFYCPGCKVQFQATGDVMSKAEYKAEITKIDEKKKNSTLENLKKKALSMVKPA